MPESITIPAGGGRVEATLWAALEPKGVVLIHPATAVTQGFYEHFARYLAELGFTTLTYDYRGTGRSRGASLRDENVTMSGWMNEDVPAVTRWAAARFPGLPWHSAIRYEAMTVLPPPVGTDRIMLRTPWRIRARRPSTLSTWYLRSSICCFMPPSAR